MSNFLSDVAEVEKDAPDLIAAAEDVAAAVEAVTGPDASIGKVSLIGRIEASMQDLLKHIAALLSNHSS